MLRRMNGSTKKTDLKSNFIIVPQANVDDSCCNFEEPELRWDISANEIVRQNSMCMGSEMNKVSFPLIMPEMYKRLSTQPLAMQSQRNSQVPL